MKRIAFNTLGCRLNQYETDALVTEFRDAGYEIVNWKESADAYVINTCTVTDRSDRKSRALINQAVRAAAGAAGAAASAAASAAPVIVATGCFVENGAPGEVADDRITYTVDNDRKGSIFAIVDGHLNGSPAVLNTLSPGRFSFGESSGGFHTRSAVKIQDGCDNSCSFCIIPKVRGRGVSRPLPEVISQVSASIEAGAKEIVITGVNIGSYRHEEAGFSHLLEKILEHDGDFRVRVSSIEPGDLNSGGTWEREFMGLLDHPKLCPHLHLCLQSGSDTVLRLMRRRHTVSDFLETVGEIRKRRPEFNLTTDIIVGFPGETKEYFLQTADVVRAVGFSHVHTFPFSVRSGTKAAGMEGFVSHGEKARRAKIIRDLSITNKRAYRESLIGRGELLLIEKIENEIARGYGEHYVPIEVELPGGGSGSGTNLPETNSFLPVKVAGLGSGDDPVLKGVALPAGPRRAL